MQVGGWVGGLMMMTLAGEPVVQSRGASMHAGHMEGQTCLS
jgi:hypothetical protein